MKLFTKKFQKLFCDVTNWFNV